MALKRILFAIILVFPTAFLIAFIIANRQMVTLTLDPFQTKSEHFTYQAPFFIWLFIFLGLGILLGSVIHWLTYHKCKKALKKSKAELEKLKMSIANMT
ncbi:lipopolysaccharide assembly protein LapA domain-containing protein [Bartonella raoultii]|uniref:Lipopolysaccharide assembly protein LapA domain-containing protein n=1 Tax=Bartonella raoultii TaxID=1457020 RepID=A0ABS7I3N8_9HYPH|nr:lipopolysaccharide assembly protein LapA domain-containing protein [Bartonella raoultii]MBX4335284.1 lipopolysaccharide assembly protein LapA domain-containing protein [Bartonella raoultii]